MTKGNAVPSFSPASPVRLKRTGSASCSCCDLHVRRKDGIGRREQRAEQHGGAQRQTESGHRERGDTSDGEHHRDASPAGLRHASADRIPAAAALTQP